MTVLENTDEELRAPPPRKKICLSSSRSRQQAESRDSIETWIRRTVPSTESCSSQSPSQASSQAPWLHEPKNTDVSKLVQKPYSNNIVTSVSNQIDPLCTYWKSLQGKMISSYEPNNHARLRLQEEEDIARIDCNYNIPPPPITPLVNLGNTCFLNSILYTLRFAPSFLHKLHHLNSDSQTFIKQLYANNQERTHSLGRNFTTPMMFKEPSTLNQGSCSEIRMQQVVEKLHHLYRSLNCNELKESRLESFQPDTFLYALREVNPIFEGNQQQDAHELLVCLLDVIREVCEVLYQQSTILQSQLSFAQSTSSNKLFNQIKKSIKYVKSIGVEKESTVKENNSDDGENKYAMNGDDTRDQSNRQEGDTTSIQQQTIFEDFQGVSALRTTCLECEQVTERKETFCDVCVPVSAKTDDIGNDVKISEFYHSIVVTEEYLIGNNKYWCENCSRYNEARQCVRYEKLPRLLTLHLNRFSSNFRSIVSKVNAYMPTPFTLYCFCEECNSIENMQNRPHVYHLYAIIMHLGGSIASGHYVAYVKTYDNVQDYANCTEDKPKTSSLSRGSSLNSTSVNTKNNNEKQNGSSMITWKFLKKPTNIPYMYPKTTCKGIECCSTRFRGILDHSDKCSTSSSNSVWLECDDESVRIISHQELEDTLNSRSDAVSGLTPYLLFYARNNTCL